jgi:signal transduction histidine kinase
MVVLEQFRLALRRDESTLRPSERESMLTRDNGSEVRVLAMLSFPFVAALAWPNVADSAHALYVVAVLGILLLNALGWLVPWTRYPRFLESVPPLASLAFVWLMAATTGGFSNGFGMLVVVPIIWVALYADPWDIIVALTIVAALALPPMHKYVDALPDQGTLTQRITLVLLSATVIFGIRPIVGALREQVRASRRATYSLRASQAALAHDLRTPLTSMCALSELADQRLDDDTVDRDLVREYVRRISSLGWRAEGIIRGVLDLSRAAELLPEASPIAVRPLVREVAEMVDHVRVELGDLPETIVGHESSIRRLFANLFENAALHGVGPGRDDVARVEVTGADHVGGWIFTVRDHGRGIPPDEASLVFEPWRRGTDAHDGGHGLGLAIVGAIVEQHGGTIAVAEAEPSGAAFTFTLSRSPRLASSDDEVVARSATGVPLA